MVKLIVKITKLVVATLLALFVSSCVNINSLEGDGNVITTKRKISSFDKIDVSNGLEVTIKQGNQNYVEVEADSNLQEHIFTEVENNILKVYCDVNISKSKARKIFIEAPLFIKIKTSSGVMLHGANDIKGSDLSIDTSSGSEVNLSIATTNLICESSSGSQITLSGFAENSSTDTSSGSSINLSNLASNNVDAEASSGSLTLVNAKNNLIAKASSGSTIKYLIEPTTISKEESSGGSVSKK